MRVIYICFIAFLFHSCCSPHFTGHIDPLYLEPDGYEVSCLLRPCKTGEGCRILPWLNTEFEQSNFQTGKIGLSYLGYSDHFMMSFTSNYISNYSSTSPLNGLGFEAQLGTLGFNDYFTTFASVEYNRLWNSSATHQFHPTIGFAAPLKAANAIQIKGGYQVNHNTPNYWTIGVNLKTPLLHYLIN